MYGLLRGPKLWTELDKIHYTRIRNYFIQNSIPIQLYIALFEHDFNVQIYT